MNKTQIAVSVIASVVLLLALAFISDSYNLLSYKFFAPKMENARREVYENTQSYVEGKRQELTKYRLEYMQAKDADSRNAIKITVLQSFANVNEEKLPADLRVFLHQMKEE